MEVRVFHGCKHTVLQLGLLPPPGHVSILLRTLHSMDMRHHCCIILQRQQCLRRYYNTQTRGSDRPLAAMAPYFVIHHCRSVRSMAGHQFRSVHLAGTLHCVGSVYHSPCTSQQLVWRFIKRMPWLTWLSAGLTKPFRRATL